MDLNNIGDMLSGGKDTVKDKATDKIGEVLKKKGLEVKESDIKGALDKGEELLQGVLKKEKK